MGGWITFGNGGHSVSRHRNLARFQSHIFLCSILVALTATTNADPFSKTDVTLKSNVNRALVAGTVTGFWAAYRDSVPAW